MFSLSLFKITARIRYRLLTVFAQSKFISSDLVLLLVVEETMRVSVPRDNFYFGPLNKYKVSADLLTRGSLDSGICYLHGCYCTNLLRHSILGFRGSVASHLRLRQARILSQFRDYFSSKCYLPYLFKCFPCFKFQN